MAILCTIVAPAAAAVPALACWAAGIVLYVAAAVLVAARLSCQPVGPTDLNPPYWVSMGATAISVVAGTALLRDHTIGAPHAIIEATSLALWGFGTLLIPLLLAVGWWRHVHHRIPVIYHAGLWSIVFPLGMYALAAHETGIVEHVPLAATIGVAAGWIAFAAWALICVSMAAGSPRREQ